MTPAARIAATVDLLVAVEDRPRRPADATVNDFFRARRFIGSGDRRAIAERAFAIMRQRRRLDWHLVRCNMKPNARALVIAHMALSEGADVATIAAAFPGGQYAAPPLIAAETRIAGQMAGKPLADPWMPEEIALNLPDWAIPGLRARFGDDLAAAAAGLDEAAPLDLRANILKTTREEAIVALAAEGIVAAPTPLSPWGIRVEGRRAVTATKPFLDGRIEVQDEGSQMVGLLADARPGMRVADWCAGAAGKTLAMAATMGNRGRIAACDVSAVRLVGAAKRLARGGVDNAETHLIEPGDRWAKRRAGTFDRVLVDAPCTGTGTWRRNPDARLRLVERDLLELVPKQAAILDAASRLVRKGGRLVYATCSVLTEENEAQVQAFVAAHPDFTVLPLARAWAMAGAAPGAGEFLSLTPRLHGTDGFFTAVLERTGEVAAAQEAA